jgi:hypothetical protein
VPETFHPPASPGGGSADKKLLAVIPNLARGAPLLEQRIGQRDDGPLRPLPLGAVDLYPVTPPGTGEPRGKLVSMMKGSRVKEGKP